MQGKTSCHTGWLHSTGMMVPMGFFLGLGYANVIGDPNDIESLRDTIFQFFNENSSIPEPGTQYYGFSGALRCLSDGAGEVAFAKDNTVSQYCTQKMATMSKNGVWMPRDMFLSNHSLRPPVMFS